MDMHACCLIGRRRSEDSKNWNTRKSRIIKFSWRSKNVVDLVYAYFKSCRASAAGA